MIPFYYDSTMIILIPAILLTMYAQNKVNSTYREYVRVPNRKGISGQETARQILDRNGLSDVRIEQVRGMLSDHYDPRTRVLRLSPEVYGRATIASSAIAAHEVGHAIQHSLNYRPLVFRNAIVPLVGFATQISWMFILAGIFMGYIGLMDLGIILFSTAVLFQLVTLPVEFDASKRALKELETNGILNMAEIPQGKKVLDAAALTYVAAASTAILQLLRLIAIRNRRQD